MSGLQAELVDEGCQITLPRVLDVPLATSLREFILENVQPGMNVTIKSDAVEQVTTPGIQVLMAVAGLSRSPKGQADHGQSLRSVDR